MCTFICTYAQGIQANNCYMSLIQMTLIYYKYTVTTFPNSLIIPIINNQISYSASENFAGGMSRTFIILEP